MLTWQEDRFFRDLLATYSPGFRIPAEASMLPMIQPAPNLAKRKLCSVSSLRPLSSLQRDISRTRVPARAFKWPIERVGSVLRFEFPTSGKVGRVRNTHQPRLDKVQTMVIWCSKEGVACFQFDWDSQSHYLEQVFRDMQSVLSINILQSVEKAVVNAISPRWRLRTLVSISSFSSK